MVLTSDQQIAVVFIEALFFGLYLSSLLSSLRWLVFADEGWKCRKDIHWSMLVVTLVIFSCLTADTVLTLRRTMIDSMAHPADPLAPATIPEVHLDGWVDVVLCTNNNMIILLADAVLIHRLWLIYRYLYRVILFPLLLWVGAFVCTVLQVYWKTAQVKNLPGTWQSVNMTVGPGAILTPFWGGTMVLNIYATVMITLCIYRMVRRNDGVSATNSLQFLMRVFIESGFMYLIVTTSHFIVWWTPSPYAITIVAAMNGPMMAIAFNLIIIRTGAKKAELSMRDKVRPHESSMQFAVPTINAVEGITPSTISSLHTV